MRKQRTKSVFVPVALVACGLLLAAGCAETADEGGDGDVTERQSELLFSASPAETESDPSDDIWFGYSPTDGWSVHGVSTKRQASQHGGDGIGTTTTTTTGGSTDGSGEGQFSGGSQQGGSQQAASGPSPQFTGNSEISVRFYGGGQQASRFSGASNSSTRFSGTTSASSRFTVDTTGRAAVCDPTALCDFAEAVCDAYPNASGLEGYSESCSPSAIQECRTEMNNLYVGAGDSEEEQFAQAFLCFFSAFARCATEGINSAGSISTEEDFARAVARGLQTCSLNIDVESAEGGEFEFSFDSDDETEQEEEREEFEGGTTGTTTVGTTTTGG